ncbi:hypothetical protein QVD17_06942 [Tagetes erecta]|uniref:Uncharacterized protein n=1 Tax=Tagetes erecta TaxID=13708 RepID=A0AAD8LF68_TARER|nr:hypothetical protein QVD17_06942 [Tagetes erecta]
MTTADPSLFLAQLREGRAGGSIIEKKRKETDGQSVELVASPCDPQQILVSDPLGEENFLFNVSVQGVKEGGSVPQGPPILDDRPRVSPPSVPLEADGHRTFDAFVQPSEEDSRTELDGARARILSLEEEASHFEDRLKKQDQSHSLMSPRYQKRLHALASASDSLGRQDGLKEGFKIVSEGENLLVDANSAEGDLIEAYRSLNAFRPEIIRQVADLAGDDAIASLRSVLLDMGKQGGLRWRIMMSSIEVVMMTVLVLMKVIN